MCLNKINECKTVPEYSSVFWAGWLLLPFCLLLLIHLGSIQWTSNCFGLNQIKNLNSPNGWVTNVNSGVTCFLHVPDPFLQLFHAAICLMASDLKAVICANFSPHAMQLLANAVRQVEFSKVHCCGVKAGDQVQGKCARGFGSEELLKMFYYSFNLF